MESRRGKITIFEGLAASGRADIARAYTRSVDASLIDLSRASRVDWKRVVDVISGDSKHLVLIGSWIDEGDMGIFPIHPRVLERYVARCATIVVHCRMLPEDAADVGVSGEVYIQDAVMPMSTSLPLITKRPGEELFVPDNMRTLAHFQGEGTLGNLGAPIVIFHYGRDVPDSEDLADGMARAFMKEDKFLWVDMESTPPERWAALANGGKVALLTRQSYLGHVQAEILHERGIGLIHLITEDHQEFIDWARKVIEHPL